MRIADLSCEVVSNIELATDIFHLKLKVNNFPPCVPGQFVMLQINKGISPFLRRPFAIFNQEKNFIEIGYRVIGEGTRLLSEKRKGEYVKILGPLGNGFKVSKDKESLIIAGGIGIASVFYLARNLGRKATVLFGAKSKKELAFLEFIRKTSAGLSVATEDGSYGKRGFVTSMLNDDLLQRKDIIYACGPAGMLRIVAEFAEKHNIECQVSLEARMACGFGVCLGCVVPVKNSGSEEREYLRVCADGPVFDARAINWDLLNETFT